MISEWRLNTKNYQNWAQMLCVGHSPLSVFCCWKNAKRGAEQVLVYLLVFQIFRFLNVWFRFYRNCQIWGNEKFIWILKTFWHTYWGSRWRPFHCLVFDWTALKALLLFHHHRSEANIMTCRCGSYEGMFQIWDLNLREGGGSSFSSALKCVWHKFGHRAIDEDKFFKF